MCLKEIMVSREIGQWVGGVTMKKEMLFHAVELYYLKQLEIVIEWMICKCWKLTFMVTHRVQAITWDGPRGIIK